MTGLEFVPLVVGAVGAAASAYGSIQQGEAQEQQARQASQAQQREADSLRQKANEEEAASQRQAITASKKADTAMSRATALAAASGSSATDPTVLNLMGDLSGQGEYNALTAMYSGEARGAGLRDQADVDEWKSKNSLAAIPSIQQASLLSGVSGFATNASRLFSTAKNQNLFG